MFGKKEEIQLDKVDTIVGKGTKFKGTLTAASVIRVDGQVEGEIVTDGDVFIGESGAVLANINARNVTVAGEVKGNIQVAAKLELTATGKIFGDIGAKKLVVEEGSILDGNCKMTDDKSQKKEDQDKVKK